MSYKIQTKYIPKDVPIIDIHHDYTNLIDEYLRKASKAKDELIFKLFEECGYPIDSIRELIEAGVIEGERCTSAVDPGIEWIICRAYDETLFIIIEKYDQENHTISLGYKKLKGDKDGTD